MSVSAPVVVKMTRPLLYLLLLVALPHRSAETFNVLHFILDDLRPELSFACAHAPARLSQRQPACCVRKKLLRERCLATQMAERI